MRWLNESMGMADAVDLLWPDRQLVVGARRRKCIVSYDRESKTFSGALFENGADDIDGAYVMSATRLPDALEWAIGMTADGTVVSSIDCIGFNGEHVYCSMSPKCHGDGAIYKSSFRRMGNGCDNVVALGTPGRHKALRYIKERLEFDSFGMDAFVADLVDDGRYV